MISNEKLLAVTVEYDNTYSEIKGYSHLPSTIESIEGSKLESVKINDDTSKNYYSAFWIENYDAMTEKLGELFNWYDIFATNIPIEIYRKINGDWSKIKTFNSVIDWRKDSDLHIKYFFKTKKYASNMILILILGSPSHPGRLHCGAAWISAGALTVWPRLTLWPG